jgi:hypothetical protein
MQVLANSNIFWVFAFVALIVVYLLPTLIGGVDRPALVFLVNLIGAPAGIGLARGMPVGCGEMAGHNSVLTGQFGC